MHIPDDEGAEEMALNLTPMIDVVFLLLVFFMVATTFLDPEREIGIDLPQAQSGAPREEIPDEIVINVLKDGAILMGGARIGRDELEESLVRAARRDPATPVTIRGDRLAHHEAIVAVMDACGVAGLSNLSVGTLERSGG